MTTEDVNDNAYLGISIELGAICPAKSSTKESILK